MTFRETLERALSLPEIGSEGKNDGWDEWRGIEGEEYSISFDREGSVLCVQRVGTIGALYPED